MFYQQQININQLEKSKMSLELIKNTGTILKRKVGYAWASDEHEINNSEINEEEQIRSEKRNKMMDIDTIVNTMFSDPSF